MPLAGSFPGDPAKRLEPHTAPSAAAHLTKGLLDQHKEQVGHPQTSADTTLGEQAASQCASTLHLDRSVLCGTTHVLQPCFKSLTTPSVKLEAEELVTMHNKDGSISSRPTQGGSWLVPSSADIERGKPLELADEGSRDFDNLVEAALAMRRIGAGYWWSQLDYQLLSTILKPHLKLLGVLRSTGNLNLKGRVPWGPSEYYPHQI